MSGADNLQSEPYLDTQSSRALVVDTPFKVGILIAPGFVPRDIFAVHTVLTSMPGSQIHFISKGRDAIKGLGFFSEDTTTRFEDCPIDLDVFAVGTNSREVQNDPEVIAFTQRVARSARFVIGVCGGVALLGAAGLIRGKAVVSSLTASDMLSNFASDDLLRRLGAAQTFPPASRTVIDGNLYTAGPGSASVEIALLVAQAAFGKQAIERVGYQLI